ncbi:hypothetical protein B0T26DRAFT_727168 [Lasiosphaeria miniovina]|uniref:Secreted protein n=1 Tax=Lasiosphaeria miniovina TaxID=1954250 RepID=A0AA39ZZL0_9PEZI|nr:uncharacterized protein B0T26DRAFT_727168 [Lasiosphaeria miniovina]KAK0706577.1 hypothetical protein B0T26DRAFT_727168 [Lasiosphaeria miniovina]
MWWWWVLGVLQGAEGGMTAVESESYESWQGDRVKVVRCRGCGGVGVGTRSGREDEPTGRPAHSVQLGGSRYSGTWKC